MMLRKLLFSDRGQDMIEYALLGSFISIVAITIIKSIGPLVDMFYGNIENAVETNDSGADIKLQ